jgi:excisionase family DNA binding protein
VSDHDVAPIQRTALSRSEAAASMGLSLDSFERWIQPSIRLVRVGRVRLVPVAELERWLEQNAEHTITYRKAVA